ncbi:MAG TPA: leucyl aminopeptidase family protein [Candidatus Krumholzibacteria bacterium]|nr:leucyl aminopeptidase family protein [Candidatus Krumholzibacteria bacterium]
MVELKHVSPDAKAELEGSEFDCVIAVGPMKEFGDHPEIQAHLDAAAAVDARSDHLVTLRRADDLAGRRLVMAPTGQLDRDFDDVRRFGDAALRGIQRAREAGARKPLLVVAGVPSDPVYGNAQAVSVLQALGALWEPLEAREALGEADVEPMEMLGFVADRDGDAIRDRIRAVEAGRRLARDLGGTEPERMAPPRFAELCEAAFAGSNVEVEIVSDRATLEREYPLMMAVGRASMQVERHHPRVIRLEYQGSGPIERTILLAGKGVVYDTGGADIKAGGHMAGMSRDKGGAAAVAGFVKTVSELAPANVRVIAEIGAVRNSVGEDCFVSDEIITSHAGIRVRIGNTDAEGRLVLADCLSHLREKAVDAENPMLFSAATLTGHAALAAGPNTIAVENGAARAQSIGARLSEAGDLWGDTFEVNRSRREDFEFIAPRSKADDVLSCNNKPSSATPRGHQFPMAFLVVAAGLSDHGLRSERPLPFTHLDVAGSATEGGDWQHGRPTGAPIPALAAALLE